MNTERLNHIESLNDKSLQFRYSNTSLAQLLAEEALKYSALLIMYRFTDYSQLFNFFKVFVRSLR